MRTFRLRDLTPHGLYARLATLVAFPVIVIFAIFTFYYYQEHIYDVNEKLSQSIAREVGLISEKCANGELAQPEQRAGVALQLGLEIECNLSDEAGWPEDAITSFAYRDALVSQMQRAIEYPSEVRLIDNGSRLDFRTTLDNGNVTRVRIDRKRALAANTHFMIVWVLLGAIMMLALAFAFLRNQVRSVLSLTEAAKAYGRGRDLPGFRPSGATEIRDAARAVLEMRAKLTGFTEQRTEMLAAVSHDLRTPLTRLKLQLAMMEPSDEIDGARQDLDDMSSMLDEYLAFAEGEESREAESVRLDHILSALIERVDGVRLSESTEVTVSVRRLALTRTINNLINNAVAYGSLCEVRLLKGPKRAEIIIDDNGPGIPENKREDAFKPFHRLEDARTQNVSGSGLGLALARDFAKAHGGDIRLEDSPLGGLRVRLRLPY